MNQLPVWFYAYGTIGVANHVSDWSVPNFRRIQFVVLDPTIVRDNQAFWPWFVVVGICSAVAIWFKPPASKQSYHCSIDQKTSVRMQKSSSCPGILQECFPLSSSTMLYWWQLYAIQVICHLSHDGYKIRHFLAKASWYGCRPVHWSYGNVIGDGGFSSASSGALRQICLVPAFFDDEHVVNPYVVKLRSKTKSHMFGPHLVKVHSMTKSSNKGHIFGPHLVKVCSETKSTDKGHILDHIWLKSTAWQSPLIKGTIWTTFGQSPLHDKVLQQGAQFGPH